MVIKLINMHDTLKTAPRTCAALLVLPLRLPMTPLLRKICPLPDHVVGKHFIVLYWLSITLHISHKGKEYFFCSSQSPMSVSSDLLKAQH